MTFAFMTRLLLARLIKNPQQCRYSIGRDKVADEWNELDSINDYGDLALCDAVQQASYNQVSNISNDRQCE